MKKFRKFLILSLILPLVISSVVFAQEEDVFPPNRDIALKTQTYEEILKSGGEVQRNELVEIQNIQINSNNSKEFEVNTNSSMDDLNEFQNFTFDSVLREYSKDELLKMGYSNEDISIFEKYRYVEIENIPTEVLRATGAQCAVNLQKCIISLKIIQLEPQFVQLGHGIKLR